VYKIDDKMLSALDELENHPKYYVRREIGVMFDGGSTLRNCWAYLLPNFPEEMLKLPFMSNYSSSGDHGLPYVPRCMRNN